MFRRLFKLGIGAQSFFGLAIVAIPALLAAGVLGGTLITTVHEVSSDVEIVIDTARKSGEIRSLIEKQYGLVTRLPAELDQERVNAFVAQISSTDKQIDVALTALARNGKAITPELAAQFRELRQASALSISEVVKAVRSFSQTTAMELINGQVEINTSIAMALLDAIDSNVHAIAGSARNELDTSVQQAYVLVPLGIVTVLMAIAFGLYLTRRSVVRPLRDISSAMTLLAEGNLNVPLTGEDRGDEIGWMVGAVRVFRESMLETERMRAEQAAAEARVASERRAELNHLAQDFKMAVGNIVSAVSVTSERLGSHAKDLAKTAESTEQLAVSAAAASEESSINVQSVAAATEELAGSVQEVRRQTAESSRTANDAVAQAISTNEKMAELSQAAGRIGAVVQLISSIAAQTNLLALNATIEAARAGEAGRGFAVVAQEVKTLAAQTAQATKEIENQISELQNVTQDSLDAIERIDKTIRHVSGIVDTISLSVEQQGEATLEIAKNIQEASVGTGRVAADIVNVNRGASETGAVSSDILASAQTLAHESLSLKQAMEAFLSKIEAA